MMNSTIRRLIVFFFFSAVFLNFIMPVWDVDFPWHVKTGEYIIQHHEIPYKDPFSIASNGSMTEKFLLSNYWLAQVFLYLVFINAGPIGIVLLRALLLSAIIMLLWRSLKNTPLMIKASLLFFASVLFLIYSGERPQLFSFLFCLVLIILMEDFRIRGSIRSLSAVPLLMLLWANMHGGFIYGDCLIAVICTSEAIKYIFFKKHVKTLNERSLFMLIAAGALSIGISFINPNTYHVLTVIMDNYNPGGFIIREYISPLAEVRSSYVNINNMMYWLLMGYCLVVLILNMKHVDLTHWGLILFTLAISLTAVRYVPFFVMTGLLVTDYYISGINQTKIFAKYSFPINVLTIISVLLWLGFCAYKLPDRGMLTEMGRSMLHCEKAARFIDKNLRGATMFNSPSTGGYLIMRLYPNFKVFTDPRAYNMQNVMETDSISAASRWDGDKNCIWETIKDLMPSDYGTVSIKLPKKPSSAPEKELWSELLEKHKVDVIVHEACSLFSGDLYALPLRLIKSEEWRLVYLDGRVLIFVKNLPKYKDLIGRYELDKNKVYDEIGMESTRGLSTLYPAIYSNMAFALLMKGNPDTVVREYIDHALYLDSKDLLASYLEAFLSLKQRQTKSK